MIFQSFMAFLYLEKLRYFIKIKKIISTAKLRFDSTKILHLSFFTLSVLDIVKGFDNYNFNSGFGPWKISIIISAHTKMLMFITVIAWFVFNFVCWFLKPICTLCHSRNAGSVAWPQPGGYGGRSPLTWRKCNCICTAFQMPPSYLLRTYFECQWQLVLI